MKVAPVILNLNSLEAMVAGGATAKMLLTTLRAQQDAADAAAAEQRRKDKLRKRRERVSGVSNGNRGNSVTSRDIADTAQAIGEGERPQAQAAVVNGSGENVVEFGKKEIPPTPPKEKLLPSSLPSDDLFGKIGSVNARARRNERATRLPDDWVPSLDDLAFARPLLPDAQIAIEIEKFRDYWHARAGPGAVKRSWAATWRNWCRKHVENGRSNGGGNGQNRGRGGAIRNRIELARRATAQ